MKRLRLRASTESDLDFVLAAENDGENSSFVGHWLREQHRAAFEKPNTAHWIIETVAEGKPVGYAIVDGLENPHGSVELMRIVVSEKGQGYGREAIRLIQGWAFGELKAHRLWLDVKSENHRAQHVYEAEGFVTEGLLRDCLKTENGFESLIVMSILESEYQG